MRTLPAGILAHLADRRYRAVHLLEIRGGATTYRWTDAPFEISYGGHTWTQQPFFPSDAVTDETGDQVLELELPDVDRVVRAALITEDWTHRPATVWELWLSTADNTPLGAFILADGRADGGSVNFTDERESARIAILPGAEAEGAPGPSQNYQASCRYQAMNLFKGQQCGYAEAETTCDGTVTRCRVLGNEARFGGSQYAPAPGERLTVGTGTTTVGAR